MLHLTAGLRLQRRLFLFLVRTSPPNVIVIPNLFTGKPPAWTPPVHNRQLDRDSGNFFRDPNAARFPKYPMEPAVRAILQERPNFIMENIDIFTCSSVFGNLSRFVRGVDKEFRFIMEKIGNTVFFVRRERTPGELIPNVKGYGHTFLDEYTTWESDVRGSVSHQRIIQYHFGGLGMLVRFESDGHFSHGESNDDTAEKGKASSSLDDLLGGVSISAATNAPSSNQALHITKAGNHITQNDVFDVKTRSAFNFATRQLEDDPEIDMTDITPRLWASQIPTLIAGFHNRGVFDNIQTRDIRHEVQQWEEDNAEALRKLASLMKLLIEFADTSGPVLEVYRSERGPVEIREVVDGEGPRAMSDEVRALLMRKET